MSRSPYTVLMLMIGLALAVASVPARAQSGDCDCTVSLGTCSGGIRVVNQSFTPANDMTRDKAILRWTVELNAGASPPQCAQVKAAVEGSGIAGMNSDLDMFGRSIYVRVLKNGNPVQVSDYQSVSDPKARVVESGFHQSCQICKSRQDAKGVAKDVKPNQSDAANLAKQLGVAFPSKDSSDEYTVKQLEQSIEKWKAEKKAEQEEQERQRRIREEQERLAAIERAKREAIQREQLAARQQQLEEERQERERQAMSSQSESSKCTGVLGFLGCVAEGVGKAAYDHQKREMMTSGWPLTGSSADSTSDDGDSCRTDLALVSRVQSIMQSCGNEAGDSVCNVARATAACFGRAAAAAGSCASVAAQARDLQSQYAAQAQAVCGR